MNCSEFSILNFEFSRFFWIFIIFKVYPDYLPVGEDDAIELVFGKGQKTKTPLSVTMHRIILDKSKKQSKIVVQKTDFIIGNVQLHNSFVH